MGRIWYPETDAIVIENWGKLPNADIADLVNAYLYKINKSRYKAWNQTGAGGVQFAALRLGLITEDEYCQKVEEWKKGKQRARAKAGYIPLELRTKILLRDKRCLCCGTTEDLTVDHIMPVVFGGKSEMDNLQTLCQSCNSSKGARNIDYRKWKEYWESVKE